MNLVHGKSEHWKQCVILFSKQHKWNVLHFSQREPFCSDFPCTKFKRFTKRWLKYGQNFIENQKLLKNVGEVKFLKYYNERVHDQLTNNDRKSGIKQ